MPVTLSNLGLVPYDRALELQHELVGAHKAGHGTDTLLLLEHPPVLTLGRNAHSENILASPEYLDELGIRVFRVERGGDVTYHGPGQLVGYPILDLHHFRRDIGWYIRSLEDVLIQTLNSYGLEAHRAGLDANGRRDSKLVGVWVPNPTDDPLLKRVQPEAKIAQIGARIERWITYHGFALNIDPQMRHFDLIVPCGITDKPVTCLARVLGRPVSMTEVRERVAHCFENVFDVALEQSALTPAV